MVTVMFTTELPLTCGHPCTGCNRKQQLSSLWWGRGLVLCIAAAATFLLCYSVSTVRPINLSGTALDMQVVRTTAGGFLSDSMTKFLNDTCTRVRWRTLEQFTTVFEDHVFVATGDIDDMWLRDSAVQFRPFLGTPRLQPLVERLIKTQAYFILQDPYANSFRKHWARPLESERGLRRGGWVATGNWEPDSLAYFLHLLCDSNILTILGDTSVSQAVHVALDVLEREQHHSNHSSPYRYAELSYGGKGEDVGYTGMVWGAFRPSDDKQAFGYNIPVNMFIHSALEKLRLRLVGNKRIDRLMEGIDRGIRVHGVVDGIYAYEVDGLGHSLVDFDDANLPSLLSIPLYAKAYDARIYARTRQRVLSSKNPVFFKSAALEGVGSPHTPSQHVWPLAVMARAMTAADDVEFAAQIEFLASMTCGNGRMHESVSVENVAVCTRPDFEWANTMFVELVSTRFPDLCSIELDFNRITHAFPH